MREIAVFGGTAHPALAAEICADLGVPPRPVRFTRFANDCLEVQLQSNCRDRDVFLIQPLVPPVRENRRACGSQHGGYAARGSAGACHPN